MSTSLLISHYRFKIQSFISKKMLAIVPLLFSAVAYADCPDTFTIEPSPTNNAILYVWGTDSEGNVWRSQGGMDLANIIVNEKHSALVTGANDVYRRQTCTYKTTISFHFGGQQPNFLIGVEPLRNELASIDFTSGLWSRTGPEQYICFFDASNQCRFSLPPTSTSQQSLVSPF